MNPQALLEEAQTRQQQLETDKRALEEKRVADLQEQAVQYETQIRDMKNIHKQVRTISYRCITTIMDGARN